MPTCHRSHWCFGGGATAIPWDSPKLRCHQPLSCFRGRDFPTSWDSSKPQCHPRRGCFWGWGAAGLATRRSVDSKCRADHRAQADRCAPLCSSSSVTTERPQTFLSVSIRFFQETTAKTIEKVRYSAAKVSIAHHSLCAPPTVAIPASARPPSSALPGDRPQQPASICLGQNTASLKQRGATVTAKLLDFQNLLCLVATI